MATKNIVPNDNGEGGIGVTGKRWNTAFINTITGDLTGNVTGNVSGTAATVTGAAQSNITSLGTLTTLTVDDITINGSTISDAGDLLFDVGGDISLDAAGGDFIFLIGGSQYGKINFLGTNNLTISGSAADHAGLSFATHAILPAEVSATTDGTIDLGASSEQFKTIFLSTGVVLANDGTIGSAGTTNAITIESNGAATFTSSVIGSRLFSGDGGNTTNPMIANALDQDTGIFFPATNTMAFTAGNAEIFRISSNGVVSSSNSFHAGHDGSTGSSGAGTTTVGASLTSSGAITAHRTNATTLFIGTTTDREVMAIFKGTSQAGNITITGDSTVNFGNGSDYRLKEDLKDFNGLNIISQLKVYDFNWIGENRRDYGLIAHEVQEILPNLVTGEKDGMKEDNVTIEKQSVDYGKFTPALIKAMQEQQAIIEDLKARIEVLEG